MRTVLLTAFIALGAACTVEDADLRNAAIVNLTAAPATTATNVFSVAITGSASFGYVAAAPATLSISVDGQPVHEAIVAVTDALATPFAATIPLARQGSNAVVVELSYQGEKLTRTFPVAVAMDAPTLTFPTWTSAYAAHQGMTVTGNVVVAAAAAYSIDSVLVSVDGSPWMPAAATVTAGTYAVTIENPDIGDNAVAVAVVTSEDGHTQTTTFHDVLTVNAVFDCETPGASMLPDNDFIRNFRAEVRTMVGYFGAPDGGHDIAFILSADVPGEGLYQNIGKVVARGYAAMSVEYNVERLDCGTDGCSLGYDLELFVDGVSFCGRTNFGVVTRF